MKCPKCEFENTDTARYCSSCAAPLQSSEGLEVTETLEAPKEELTTGSIFAGRYEIVEELGKGGMGRVYRAIDNKVEEEIALKLLKPEIAVSKKTIKRFRNELKLARKITHKNVCRMFDFHEEEKTPFITMEYVRGESLKASIQKQGILPEEKTIDIAQQICKGLLEAHAIRVIHRDLKPQNIMMDLGGNAKIMDFGIAHFLEAEGVTQTGMIIGTPDYISPEQAEGKKADQRSDIYSMGIILYEMVTGKVPFKGDTALSIALKHKTEIPLNPRKLNDKISDDLSSVILKCLEKDSEARFQNVNELLAELTNIEEGLSLTTEIKRPPVPGFLIEGKEVELERPIFVAREEELAKLEGFFDQVLSGKGQVVFVKGEAGSGKTALIQEFAWRAQEAHSDLIVAGGNCNAHTGIGDPYLPFIEILGLLTGDVETKWSAGVITKEDASRLWNLIPISIEAISEKGSDLIDVFVPGSELVARGEVFISRKGVEQLSLKKSIKRITAHSQDSTLQQSNLFEQYTRVIQALAHQIPLLFILDDLQWVDVGSASLLFHLGRRIVGSPILIVGAFRPTEVDLGRAGERHPLKSVLHELKRDFGDIEMKVDQLEDRKFVDAFLDTEPNQLDTTFREMLFKQTRGHPLFTIELLRDMQDRGVLVKNKTDQWIEGPELNWDALPARVDAVIEERISRLTEKLKEVLALASVEGEEFTAEVVARLQETEVRKLVRHLSSELDKQHHLVRAKGIKHLERQRLSQYLFQHILFQRYLYNSLDEVERVHLHGEVGNILEALYGEQTDEIAVQLSRHFQEAGIAEKAIEYLQKAGNKAARLCANEEAVAHFQKGLEILETLPETPERVQQELGLLLSLAVPLTGLKGYGVPEVERIYSKARKLCLDIGEKPQLFTALLLLNNFYFSRAEHQAALELVEQAVSLAQQANDPILLAVSNSFMGWSLYSQGRFVAAQTHLDDISSFYDSKKHGSLASIHPFDPGVAHLSISACNLWCLGYPDQALDRCRESISLARELGHPFTLGGALAMGSMFNLLQRDIKALMELAEELMQLSHEKGFLLFSGIGSFKSGWAMSEQGYVQEGISRLKQGLAIYEATGQGFTRIELLACLAEAYGRASKANEGLKLLSDAFMRIEKSEERYFESNLYRLKGELLLMENKSKAQTEAEECYSKAIDVAKKQKAKSLELRAVISLALLWQKQGKKEEARKRLAEIYGWFTEGFDTPDLKDAKALLEELSK